MLSSVIEVKLSHAAVLQLWNPKLSALRVKLSIRENFLTLWCKALVFWKPAWRVSCIHSMMFHIWNAFHLDLHCTCLLVVFDLTVWLIQQGTEFKLPELSLWKHATDRTRVSSTLSKCHIPCKHLRTVQAPLGHLAAFCEGLIISLFWLKYRFQKLWNQRIQTQELN